MALFENAGSAEMRAKKLTQVVPVEWGQSELTKFWEAATQNAYASFGYHPDLVNMILELDSLLIARAEKILEHQNEERTTSALLFMRAFSNFRAASWLALTGQTYAATILVRATLECGVYAWICHHSTAHRESWISRADSADQKAAARGHFRWGSLIKSLAKVDSQLAADVGQLYEQTIEYGAHPNVAGIQLHVEYSAIDENRHELATHFLQAPPLIRMSVQEVLHAMGLLYGLLRHVFNDGLERENIVASAESLFRRLFDLCERELEDLDDPG